VERVGQVLKNYWVLYYLVFIGFSGFYLWLRWKELPVGNVVDRTGALIGQYGELADVFGAAVGIALFTAILSEVTGRMVLLIPATIKRLKNEGRRERDAEWRAWYQRLSQEAKNKDLVIPEPPGPLEND
jgi:hypothetical protein